MSSDKNKTVSVVVLGDIGRSPRMQYHALSLAACDFTVDILGYNETKPLSEILQHEKINITPLASVPDLFGNKHLNYIFKTLWQTISLLISLIFKCRNDYVLCQNPPAIPTLFVCWFYCLIFRARFIIDWHNYAYSIMALTNGKEHIVVRIAKKLEFFFGAKAYAHFCVTNAMKDDLAQHWNIRAKVLYDRPPNMFRPITTKEEHNFILKLSTHYPAFCVQNSKNGHNEDTVVTQRDGEQINLNPERPGLLFSSTSWTPDEDFQILLDALEEYDKASTEEKCYPKLICVITGKGPMKKYYIDLVNKKAMKSVEIITPWLESADYPLMVASADLGVCLHTSSSGLDLPMKVIDMFGSGLPVCAFKYECLSELVKEGENGYMFENSSQLATNIKTWFKNFPNNEKQNEIVLKLKENLTTFQSQRWQANWDNIAKPLFDDNK